MPQGPREGTRRAPAPRCGAALRQLLEFSLSLSLSRDEESVPSSLAVALWWTQVFLGLRWLPPFPFLSFPLGGKVGGWGAFAAKRCSTRVGERRSFSSSPEVYCGIAADAARRASSPGRYPSGVDGRSHLCRETGITTSKQTLRVRRADVPPRTRRRRRCEASSSCREQASDASPATDGGSFRRRSTRWTAPDLPGRASMGEGPSLLQRDWDGPASAAPRAVWQGFPTRRPYVPSREGRQGEGGRAPTDPPRRKGTRLLLQSCVELEGEEPEPKHRRGRRSDARQWPVRLLWF